MARKIKNLEGHMLVVEQNELLTQIKEKSAILEESDKALLFWSSQSRNVKGILHRKRHEHEKIVSLKTDVSQRHQELTTQIQISGKLLEGLHAEKKEQFIARSMLQLTIERLRSVLKKEAGGVMAFDKIKENLDFEMKAKMLEIEANKSQINSQIQIVKTKHHELKLEISDKRFKSQQLIKKYPIDIFSFKY
ncbi:hypothetical protein HELRODRAFT_177798 [Helobdella robusta]|uniref:Coiled-coil domain-containing protein 39 n=1 Tax=Helobdella robusta TaxID=6412 RepID=T1FCA2_HELRO|nr:hypothetical protein HELRODRAFT_177798 [Helobdella robusta]ESN97738.1 hypothetical protein HELRODRAFT_177798 [Helobdella robusta]